MQPRKFTVALNCAGCGQVGSTGWEEGPVVAGKAGLSRSLIFVSAGFHKSDGRHQSGDPHIACDVCEAIQPD
jgi:hypothetical protein